MGDVELGCCPACRLVQPLGARCAGCGAATPLRFRDAPERFLARKLPRPSLAQLDLARLPRSRRVLITLAIAAAVLFGPFLLPIAVFELTGSGDAGVFTLFFMLFAPWLYAAVLPTLRWIDRGRANRLAAIAAPALLPPPGAVEHRGIARALGRSARAHLDGQSCLAAHLVVRGGDGELALQSVRAVEFLLVLDGGGELRVGGAVCLASEPARHTGPGAIAGLTRQWGLPAAVRVDGAVEETLLVDGQRVIVLGAAQTRPVAGGYRDAGTAEVLHGALGAPLLLKSISSRSR